MNTVTHKFKCVSKDGSVRGEEMSCLKEHVLEIFVNDRKRYRVVCTNDALRELVTGRLYVDGVTGADPKGYDLVFDEAGERVFVTVSSSATSPDNNTYFCDSINSPGPERVLKKLQPAIVDEKTVFALAERFREDSALHSATGAAHRSMLCHRSITGEEIRSFEDISRHNTIDKAIGYALLKGFSMEECALFTSGRVPVDMVVKVIAAGIPVLISKSVPTYDAVLLAKEYGLTLITRAWPDSFDMT